MAVAYTGMHEVTDFPVSWAFGYSPCRSGGFPSRPGSIFGLIGSNGSAAYADIGSGVAAAVIRDRFSPDLATVEGLGRIVAETL